MRAAELFTPALIRSTADVTPANVAHAVGIEVTRLDVRARGRVLVDGAHLSVAPGELVAVAGASGAGKSSLLEAVAGLRPIASGSVRFVRRDGSAPAEIAVGFVPQDDIIHRDLPLRTSLCLAARLRLAGSPSWVEIEAIVDSTLARLELLPSADVRVYELPEIHVASVVHQGNFDEFTNGHAYILKWAETNGYRVGDQYREIYVQHDPKGTSTTEIQFKVERA